MDIELVDVDVAEPPDALMVTFDAIYPGETWCRSVVLVAAEVAQGGDDEVISRARDALVSVLHAQGEPVSVEIRVAASGTDVMAVGRPGR